MTTADIRDALSQSRAFLMGLAMLMVMGFHHGYFVDFGPLGNSICRYGEWGVDIFIFLSGFGVAFSLGKKVLNAGEIRQFYQRRLHRILPTALCIGWILAPFELAKDAPFPWQNLLGLGWWYIRTILLLYLLAPLLFVLLQRRYSGFIFLVLIALSFAYGALIFRFFADVLHPYEHFHLFRTAVVTVLKVPVFALGMAVYLVGRQKTKVSIPAVLSILTVSTTVSAAVVKGVPMPGCFAFAAQFFASAFFAMPFLCGVGWFLWKSLPVYAVASIEWIGNRTLEIYLVHEFVFFKLGKVLTLPQWCNVVIVVTVSFGAACLLRQLVRLLDNGIKKLIA